MLACYETLCSRQKYNKKPEKIHAVYRKIKTRAKEKNAKKTRCGKIALVDTQLLREQNTEEHGVQKRFLTYIVKTRHEEYQKQQLNIKNSATTSHNANTNTPVTRTIQYGTQCIPSSTSITSQTLRETRNTGILTYKNIYVTSNSF